MTDEYRYRNTPPAGYGFTPDSTPEMDIYFFHSDHLGSTSYLTDSAGSVCQFVCYTPYGEAFVDEHSTSYENPFKFSGKELDDVTGLYDHGARSRNPVSTLWLGVDPVFHPASSPYAYCLGNPVKLVDPDGRSDENWQSNNCLKGFCRRNKNAKSKVPNRQNYKFNPLVQGFNPSDMDPIYREEGKPSKKGYVEFGRVVLGEVNACGSDKEDISKMAQDKIKEVAEGLQSGEQIVEVSYQVVSPINDTNRDEAIKEAVEYSVSSISPGSDINEYNILPDTQEVEQNLSDSEYEIKVVFSITIESNE